LRLGLRGNSHCQVLNGDLFLAWENMEAGRKNLDADDSSVGGVVHSHVFGQALGSHLEFAFQKANVEGIYLWIISYFYLASSVKSKKCKR